MSTGTDATLTAVTETERTIQQQLAAAERARATVARARTEGDLLVDQAHQLGTQTGEANATAIRREAEQQAERIRRAADHTAQRLRERAAAQRSDDVTLVLAAVIPSG